MLVGGGSLTPELTNVLAGKLKLPSNRVAIRDITAINQLNKDSDLPMGPDFVTPIGIAIAAKQNPIHYTNVLEHGRAHVETPVTDPSRMPSSAGKITTDH